MSFVAVPRRAARRSLDRIGLSIIRNGRAVRHACLRVAFGGPVCDALGVEAGGRIVVLWGEGGDAGRILTRRVEHEGNKLLRGASRRTSRHCVVKMASLPSEPFLDVEGHLWTLGLEYRPTVHVDYTKIGGDLIVTLPEEWWTVAHSLDALADKLEAALAKGMEQHKLAQAIGVEPERLDDVKRHALARRRLFRPIAA